MKIAILGAGVSGLALAQRLFESGFPREDLTLFEAAPVPGGLCRSKQVDGFTYDVAGGHILYSKDAEAMAWMKAHAGGEAAFVRKDRNTRIRFGDRWVHYPFENGLGDLPPETNFECIEGYVLAWHERLSKGTRAPADFASWIRWRFGEGIARHFMDPYNRKIWKRDLSELTSDWVAGRVPEAPIGDVLRAAVGIRTEGYTHQAVFFYPRRGGFQAITDGLAAQVADRVRLATPVERLTRDGEGWRVDGEPFDHVVSTIPLDVLPRVVEGIPADVAAAMEGLTWNGLVSILVALDRAEHPDLSWVYLPHPEQGPANRVTYMSNYSPGNAPEGRTSLMCEVTLRGPDLAAPEDIEEQVVEGLVRAGLVRREEILFLDRSDVRHAYIVYTHGFAERRRAAIDWLEANGITPLGRFGRYDYHNSDQCVIAAREAAARLVEHAARGGAR